MVGGEEGRRCFQLVRRRPPLSGAAEPGAGLVPAVGGAWLERLPQVIDCLCEACLHLPDSSSGAAPRGPGPTCATAAARQCRYPCAEGAVLSDET